MKDANTIRNAIKLAIENGSFPQGSGILHELRAALAVLDRFDLPAMSQEEADAWADIVRNAGPGDCVYSTAVLKVDALLRKRRTPLTEHQVKQCLIASNCLGRVVMTYESGPYDLDVPSARALDLIRCAEALHRIGE